MDENVYITYNHRYMEKKEKGNNLEVPLEDLLSQLSVQGAGGPQNRNITKTWLLHKVDSDTHRYGFVRTH